MITDKVLNEDKPALWGMICGSVLIDLLLGAAVCKSNMNPIAKVLVVKGVFGASNLALRNAAKPLIQKAKQYEVHP